MEEIYSPSRLVKALGITASTLASWEKHFPAFAAKLDEKQNKYYTDADFAHYQQVYQLVKVQGYSVEGVKLYLEKSGGLAQKKAETIQKLEAIRGFLADLRAELD